MNTTKHKTNSYIKPQDSSLGRGANIIVIVFFTVITVLALLPVALVIAASVSSEESIQGTSKNPF